MSILRRVIVFGGLITALPLTVQAAAGSVRVADHAGACPSLSRAATLPRRPGGGLLRGDVDGDQRPDEVSVRYAVNAPASCGFLVVVETRRGVFAVRVPESYKRENLSTGAWPWREPFVAAIVQLGTRGAQVVVARDHGASVVGVSIYGIVGGELARLTFKPRLYRDELSLFGTAGTGSTNVRCLRHGPLIVLGMWPASASGKRLGFSRTSYSLHADSLTRTGTRATTGAPRRIDALAHRSGFDHLPFTGCTIARGRRL
jgi:hypothetical protein